MRNNRRIQTSGVDSYHYDENEFHGGKVQSKDYARQTRSIEYKKTPVCNLASSNYHQPHNQNVFQPSSVHNIPHASAIYYPPEEEQQKTLSLRGSTSHERIEEEYAAAFTPPKSSINPPPKALSTTYISPSKPHSQKYPNMRPLSHQQQRRNVIHEHFDSYEQSRYCANTHLYLAQTCRDDIMAPTPPQYRQSSSVDPRCSDNFDQYTSFNNEHQPCHNEYHERAWHHPSSYNHQAIHQNWSRPPQSSSGPYYQEHPNDVYYDDYNDENDSHPLLRDYNPDMDGRHATPSSDDTVDNFQRGDNAIFGTNHRAAFDTMMQDTTRTLRMPEAASEVDFDVMKPPLTPITQPSEEPLHLSPDGLDSYDVLLGRGGRANTHIGNRHFRSLVQDFQPIYLTLKRKDKPLMARSLVLIVRQRGGRFLRKGEASGEYYEVGDLKAEAKTSQALREGMEVRATTRKRKENILQRIENETKRKKVTSCGQSSIGEGLEGEQRGTQVTGRAILTESSLAEDLSHSKYHGEEYNQFGDPVEFQSSSQDTAQLSMGGSFSAALEEHPNQQQQRMSRTISSDEDRYQDGNTVEEKDNKSQLHMVPLQ